MKEIILLAQKDLISPEKFYNLCQKYKRYNNFNKIYFLGQNLKNIFHKKSDYYLSFFDYLAKYINKYPNYHNDFYCRKILIYHNKKFIIMAQVKKIYIQRKSKKYDQISVRIAGEGMIGRVAKININGKNWAFKSYFYPNFIWSHSPWGEIAIGIYLKANSVTKNFAEFELGGETWTIWEWINPETNSYVRNGITYEEFAKKHGLTKLNYLNVNNYNLYQIRLDAGGIQKEYPGRRLIDCIFGIKFYFMKIKKEGILSILKYLSKKNLIYLLKRLQLMMRNYDKVG